MTTTNKVIGILGGMGPEATADLFIKIINQTSVKSDSGHSRIVVDCNPKIPDRTAAIVGRGESPVDEMIKTGRNLEKIGADVIAMPCVTAHHFFYEIQNALSCTVINMLNEIKMKIMGDYPGVKKVGVLATDGTLKTKLFNKYLGNSLTILYPDKKYRQTKVMEAVYGDKGIKQGNKGDYPLNLLKEAGMGLIEKGAQLIIAGCTEIPLVLKPRHFDVPLLNPLDVLAKALIAK